MGNYPSTHPGPWKALVYRGRATCSGCPEAVYKLLDNFPTYNITPQYVGPNEAIKLDDHDVLKNIDLFAMPGGPDLNSGWRELQGTSESVRNWVGEGGRYLGFCLGAFLAGNSPGYNLIPDSVQVVREIRQDNAQVQDSSDSVIQINWDFLTGPKADKTDHSRWVYFQDGASMQGAEEAGMTVIGRYTSNNDVAATISKFSNGYVALVGAHVEANEGWYYADGFSNPDGVKFDLGHDFLNSSINGATQPLKSRSMAQRSTNDTMSSMPKANAASTSSLPSTALLLLTLATAFGFMR